MSLSKLECAENVIEKISKAAEAWLARDSHQVPLMAMAFEPLSCDKADNG